MTQPPTPDDGLGLIGDIRTFTLDRVEWRAFEYESPFPPRERHLFLMSRFAYFTAESYPADWRSLEPADLVACVSGEIQSGG
jgi:hypothetical protein